MLNLGILLNQTLKIKHSKFIPHSQLRIPHSKSLDFIIKKKIALLPGIALRAYVFWSVYIKNVLNNWFLGWPLCEKSHGRLFQLSVNSDVRQ